MQTNFREENKSYVCSCVSIICRNIFSRWFGDHLSHSVSKKNWLCWDDANVQSYEIQLSQLRQVFKDLEGRLDSRHSGKALALFPLVNEVGMYGAMVGRALTLGGDFPCSGSYSCQVIGCVKENWIMRNIKADNKVPYCFVIAQSCRLPKCNMESAQQIMCITILVQHIRLRI